MPAWSLRKKPSERALGVFNILLSLTHIGLMGWYEVSGWFYSLPTIVIAMLAINLQLVIFDGCSITKLQYYTGGLKPGVEFVPYLFDKLFKITPSPKAMRFVYFLIISFPLIVWLVRYYS